MPPGRLLHRDWWEFSAVVVGAKRKKATESDQLAAMRMVDYVQSIIASVKPETYAEEVSDDNWNKVKADVTTLFERLTLEYQICLTAHRKTQDPGLDMKLEEFRMRAETLWLNVRGKRYHVHERRALLDVLAPHSESLSSCSVSMRPALVDEFDKVLAKLARGVVDTVPAAEGASGGQLAGEHPELPPDAFMYSLFEDKNLAALATLPGASSIRKRVLLTNESSAPYSTSQFDLIINNVG